VERDLDTLLIALYVLIDDHVTGSGQHRPGHPRQLSDAELVCLAVAQVLLGARSARLPQAPQGRRAADLPGHAVPGHVVPVVGRRSAAAGGDPGAVRHLPGNGETLQPGRMGELRLLPVVFPLVLRAEVTPAGVMTRIAQRLLALAAAIWHNWATGTTDLRCLTAYDH
jgi:hypothetical protein